MITAILGVLFVSSALIATAILASSFKEAIRLHGLLHPQLAASNDHREIRVRHIDMKVHAAVARLPISSIAGQKARGSFAPLPLAA